MCMFFVNMLMDIGLERILIFFADLYYHSRADPGERNPWANKSPDMPWNARFLRCLCAASLTIGGAAACLANSYRGIVSGYGEDR